MIKPCVLSWAEGINLPLLHPYSSVRFPLAIFLVTVHHRNHTSSLVAVWTADGLQAPLVRGTESPLFPFLPHGLQWWDEPGLFGPLLLLRTDPIPPPARFPAGEERLAGVSFLGSSYQTWKHETSKNPPSRLRARFRALHRAFLPLCSAWGYFMNAREADFTAGCFWSISGTVFIPRLERSESVVVLLSVKYNWRGPHSLNFVTEKSHSGEVPRGKTERRRDARPWGNAREGWRRALPSHEDSVSSEMDL